ncbi:MAG: DNA gyrase inhibitor YacG [bacterium]|nr:DNA gyrase inhibitor YacG [Deltaproteobacteria bacterium]MCR5220730.1 DNA gyrase inhibitor YacG [bacterium]
MRRPCPICGRECDWEGNPSRPFCSERCRLVDLGRWADESYRVPVKDDDSSPDPEEGEEHVPSDD